MSWLLIVVAVQAVVILALLVQRERRAHAERTLRESELRYRLILDRAPIMIWTSRTDTTLDYLNKTCEEFTGLSMVTFRQRGGRICQAHVGPHLGSSTQFGRRRRHV